MENEAHMEHKTLKKKIKKYTIVEISQISFQKGKKF